MTVTARRVAWLALALAVVVALGVSQFGGTKHESRLARVESISEGVRCPTCRGQSVADSAAPAAAAIRADIGRRVDAGETRAEIEAYLVGRYGDDILLTPPSGGVGGLVWVLPVVVVGAGGAALAIALRRWSRRPLAHATDADRLIVERVARRGGGDPR
jgi:cytochrome c-type biogenesis protein CcmH